jgi:protein-S-isoprenylcysteine O-methyltransferase Ste14
VKHGREAFLAFRSILFVFLIPGTVAGYIPFLMLQSSANVIRPRASIGSGAAASLIVVGASVLLRCVWDFFAAGHGTLAPFDAPRKLVVKGLYRFTRNPMYNGVVCMLIGEAWLFHSPPLWKYAALVFVLFHATVMIYEEPTLESEFGESFRRYKRAVPRWGFTRRAFMVPSEPFEF